MEDRGQQGLHQSECPVFFPRILIPVLLCIALMAVACSAPVEEPTEDPSAQARFEEAKMDWAQRFVDCLRALGVDAQVTVDGGITKPSVPGRPATGGLDQGCLDEVGEPPAAPPASQALLRGLYELYVEQAACLRDAGYTVSDPPSQDVWVESYSGESWDPLWEAIEAGADPAEAQRQCPQPDPVEAERRGSQ